MHTRFFFGIFFAVFLVAGFLLFGRFGNSINQVKQTVQKVSGVKELVSETPTPVALKQIPTSYFLPQSNFISQTYNNCGPASLSMVMSMLGKSVSQDELASKMRPFNNPYGGVDDKSIFAEEFVKYAQEYGFESLERPNGDTEILKQFVVNDIPVVVRTMLNDHEDIGHFRIVRGYDDNRGVLIQDDSYQGPGLEYSYEEFDKLWQPFNYGYILVYPPAKQDIVDRILGEEKDPKVAYQNSISRAEQELQQNPGSIYSTFNLSTANFYLGNYQKSAEYYESVAGQLPPRMFWYQTEPIENYLALKNYNQVIELSDQTLQSGNQAYSELYFFKGKAYLEQGNKDAARQEFENAVYYNSNFSKAKDELAKLN